MERVVQICLPKLDVRTAPMRGSEKQCSWASEIQMSAIAAAKSALQKLTGDVKPQPAAAPLNARLAALILKTATNAGPTPTAAQLGLVIQRMADNSSARWWIDNRHHTTAALINIVLDDVAAGPIGNVVALATARIRAEEIAEATIVPDDHNGVSVEMSLAGSVIHLIADRFSENFNALVKSRSFAWKKPFWQRDLGTLDASSAFVQLAIELMNAHYGVLIFDNELRQRVITGEYEAVSLSSVQAATCKRHGFKFRLRLAGNLENRSHIFRLFSSLRGAKDFSGTVYVPADQHVAVVELAEMYDIPLDASAHEVIKIGEALEQKKLLTVQKPKRTAAPQKRRQTVAPQATIKAELADDD